MSRSDSVRRRLRSKEALIFILFYKIIVLIGSVLVEFDIAAIGNGLVNVARVCLLDTLNPR